MPGTSLLDILSSRKSVAQARAGLNISKKAVLAETGPAGAGGSVSALAFVSGTVVLGASEQAARTIMAVRTMPAVKSGLPITHYFHSSSMRENPFQAG